MDKISENGGKIPKIVILRTIIINKKYGNSVDAPPRKLFFLKCFVNIRSVFPIHFKRALNHYEVTILSQDMTKNVF